MSEKITLAANGYDTVGLPEPWLIYRAGDGDIEITGQNLEPTVLKVGDTINLDDLTSIRVRNLTNEVNEIELQNSNRQITTSAFGAVRLSGGFLDEIKEPIPVTANATVQDGSVKILSLENRVDILKTEISPGARVQVVGVRNASSRKVSLVFLGAKHLPVHIGGDNTVDDTKGDIVYGSNDSPGYYTDEYTGSLFVYNPSTTDSMFVSGSEMWRA